MPRVLEVRFFHVNLCEADAPELATCVSCFDENPRAGGEGEGLWPDKRVVGLVEDTFIIVIGMETTVCEQASGCWH